MLARQHKHNPGWFCLLAIAVLASAAAPAAQPAWAADGELDKIDSSLKLIPKDAAFYSSMMRNREQFEAVRGSKAWTKIKDMPVVQMGLALYTSQADNPETVPGKIETVLKNPETRKIIDLLCDMASDEIFVYGDESFVDFLTLAQNLMGAMRYGPMVMELTGQNKGRNPNELQGQVLMSALAQNVDLIGAPNLVVGFKLKSTDLAKEQLIKLETIGNILLESNEQTKGRFKKTKVGESEYLILELDGAMVPWDQVPMEKLKEMQAAEGDAQKIVDRLKKSKLVIALGVRGNYLLASIGSSTNGLESLGSGDRLIDRPEFKPLKQFAGKRLVSIGYLSEAMNRQMNNNAKNIDDLLELADELLPLAKLTDQQSGRVRKDAEELANDAKKMIPEVGAMMGVSFLSEHGVEGYQYPRGEHARIDGSKPLGLLSHVGGRPILGVVGRQKMSVADYDRLSKWAKTAYGYFEEFGLPNMKEDDREKARKFLDDALPLVKRMDKINRDLLIPALADGQAALVIDAKLKSKHFIESLPAAEKPLPMVEPAIVVGVSDAKLLREACGGYREAINGLIGAVRKIEGSDVPEWVSIPEPQVSEAQTGTIFSFALPKDWGVDKQIGPYLGLSDKVAVLAASQGHVERLLQPTPLAVGGALAKPDRPRAGAVWFDWAGLVDAATPWVAVALEQMAQSQPEIKEKLPEIAPQVRTVLDVLKVLRTISAEIYIEDGVLVTHTLLEVRDVEK